MHSPVYGQPDKGLPQNFPLRKMITCCSLWLPVTLVAEKFDPAHTGLIGRVHPVVAEHVKIWRHERKPQPEAGDDILTVIITIGFPPKLG